MSLVSIIIPCYNAGHWVAETLESALAQTWPQKEIIVINDGSRDDSLAVVRRFTDRGVQVIDQPNQGASAARNHGLRQARGDFIQFLDADDLLAPDKIAQQMQRLADRPAGTLASGSWVRFTERPDGIPIVPFANSRDLSGVEFLQLNFEEICMMHPAAWLAPRALLDRAGPWNESLSLNDDGEYFARVALASTGIVFCAAARSYYRSQLAGSLSQRVDPRSLDSLYRSIQSTVDHLLAVDRSPRTLAAAAFAWKWTAFELYPGVAALARVAEENSRQLGGSLRPFPAGERFHRLEKLLGWRLAIRLRSFLHA